MRISDWSSDVCSSDLVESAAMAAVALPAPNYRPQLPKRVLDDKVLSAAQLETIVHALAATDIDLPGCYRLPDKGLALITHRSEEHTSELQPLMRNSYAFFCWKKKKQTYQTNHMNIL